MSIINFGDIKVLIYGWEASNIEYGQIAPINVFPIPLKFVQKKINRYQFLYRGPVYISRPIQILQFTKNKNNCSYATFLNLGRPFTKVMNVFSFYNINSYNIKQTIQQCICLIVWNKYNNVAVHNFSLKDIVTFHFPSVLIIILNGSKKFRATSENETCKVPRATIFVMAPNCSTFSALIVLALVRYKFPLLLVLLYA